MNVTGMEGDAVTIACRVCARELEEEGYDGPGYASFRMCPECLYIPAFDGLDQRVSYAEWGDRWARSSSHYARRREERRRLAGSRIPRDWQPGDILSIPARYGGFALGQILWLHPQHYRLHVAVQADLEESQHQLPTAEAPRADLFARTGDWALQHGIWKVIGHAALPSRVLSPQILARLNDEVVRVDPASGAIAPVAEVHESADFTVECVPPIAIASALSGDARPSQAHMYSRSFEDAARGAGRWRNPEEPLKGLAVAGFDNPEQNWTQAPGTVAMRILMTR